MPVRRARSLLAVLLAFLAVPAAAAGADALPDSTPPETTIQSGPSGRVATGRPEFGFVADEPGSTFACRIDAEPFRACNSPLTAEVLTIGDHTFEVRATDPAGNVDPTPAERGFTVDKNVSGANVEAQRSQRQRGRRISLRITVRAAEEATVVGRGSIDVGKRKVELGERRVELPANGSRGITLSPKRKADARKVRRAIRRRGKVVATVTAQFTDDLGNEATSGDVSIKLKGR